MNLKPIHVGSASAAVALLVVGLLMRDLHADEPVVTAADVARMQAALPDCERCDPAKTTGAYARTGDAGEVARAIAASARTPLEAAEATVYAAFESANNKRLVSRDGLDMGAWQLRGVDPDLAFTPARAVRQWVADADASRAFCKDNPPGTELAALVSGSCDHGRVIAKRRDDLAHRIVP